MGTYGQDWSSYQSPAPDTNGLGFAFIKVTEGLGYTNPYWQEQARHARANGLVVGFYHYPHMGNDPVAEADRFIAALGTLFSGDLIVLDWEGYDPANSGVPKSRQVAYRDAWLAHVRSKLPTHQVGLYANLDYWLNVDTTSNCGDFLWIATAGRAAGDPGIKHPWVFHQYGDQPIDKDYTPLSLDALRAFAHAKEANVPLPDSDVNRIAAATVNEMVQSGPRDELAMAVVYWLHRVMDPTIALPTANTSWVVTETEQFRAYMVAREAALTAAIDALTKAIGVGGLTAAQVQEAAQAGAAAALQELGHTLDGLKPPAVAPADSTWGATPVTADAAPAAPAK